MAHIVRETLPVVDAITERIDQDGLSYRQAADLLGTSPGTVRNWIKGNVTPPLTGDTQRNIARFLGVSPRRVVELFSIDLGDDNHPRITGSDSSCFLTTAA